ncbi:hypothetical protein [Sphingobacterium pedocola]|uniref:DUF1440 domain-containing protein n=1 Tax=Sphingobacterium pedocola TaxID=2082722 RepID=A0ABR9T2N3_9SPHI|nr:hypothetical protein [Sphingobacterium pedocola]MBE8719597.1 hypothetical protein [Sphingobacterium pedocola]
MKTFTNLIAGTAGALVLNIIHEVARKCIKQAPHMNEVGEEALVKSIKFIGGEPPKGYTLYTSTLVGDFIGNALYYSAVGKGEPKSIWLRGIGLGITAGIGAVTLPDKLGLNDGPVNRSPVTQLLTVAWYTLGGVVTSGVAQALQRKIR